MCELGSPASIMEEYFACAGCGTAVLTYWTDTGMVSDNLNSVLVADWVYHTSCWWLLLRENPPGPIKTDDNDEEEF